MGNTNSPKERNRQSGAGILADWRAPLTTTLAASSLANQIGRDVVAGTFAEDTLLPGEVEMRARYSVSRTALREAYSKLAAKGLVSARPKVGTSVRARTHWNMLDQDVLAWHLQTQPAEEVFVDLFELRRMIEPSAAELSARIRTQPDLDRIQASLDAMATSTGAQLVAADFEFHVAILNATRNPFISGFSGLIKAAMMTAFEISWGGAEGVLFEERISQHQDVGTAIRDQAPGQAREAMIRLLDDSIGDVRAALRKGKMK